MTVPFKSAVLVRALLALIICAPAAAQGSKWNVDLSANSDFKRYLLDSEQFGNVQSPHVHFIDQDLVGVSFVTQSRGDDPTLLHILFINSADGKFVGTKTWKVQSDRSHVYVFAIGHGELLIANGSEIAGYSSSGVRLNGIPIRDEVKTSFYLSPSGKNLLMKEFVESGRSKLTILTGGLARQRELDWNGHDAVGIADSGEVLINHWGLPGLKDFHSRVEAGQRTFTTADIDVKQKTSLSVCDASNQCQTIVKKAPEYVYAALMTNQLLCLGGVGGWRIQTRTGNVLFERMFSEKAESASIESTSVSNSGEKAAIYSGYLGPRWFSRLEVFEAEARKVTDSFTFTRKLKDGADRSDPFDSAFSLDGKYLVILHGSVLQKFSLGEGKRSIAEP
jgi:hypothetical protein